MAESQPSERARGTKKISTPMLISQTETTPIPIQPAGHWGFWGDQGGDADELLRIPEALSRKTPTRRKKKKKLRRSGRREPLTIDNQTDYFRQIRPGGIFPRIESCDEFGPPPS